MSTPWPPPEIRLAVESDASAIAAIYNTYVRDSVVTFEEMPVADAEIARRLAELLAAGYPWFVAEAENGVLGYAYASPWRTRRGYRFSAESTVYLAPGQGGRGIGTALYGRLCAALRDQGIHAVMGGIALPNEASVALHEKVGFRKVAHFQQTGFKFGRWVDVGYWELLLGS